MPVRRRVMDLRGRRQDLGATVKEMSLGLGMSIADILSIEKGTAEDQRVGHYAAWLTRMESWSAGKKERELRIAHQGNGLARERACTHKQALSSSISRLRHETKPKG
jgi:hypothetical protein